MKLQKIIVTSITIILIFTFSIKTSANNGKPAIHLQTIFYRATTNRADTLPPQKKTGDATENATSDEVIKTVPKARRQPIPIPVGVQIKPIILIKPKIIKPIIKILH